MLKNEFREKFINFFSYVFIILWCIFVLIFLLYILWFWDNVEILKIITSNGFYIVIWILFWFWFIWSEIIFLFKNTIQTKINVFFDSEEWKKFILDEIEKNIGLRIEWEVDIQVKDEVEKNKQVQNYSYKNFADLLQKVIHDKFQYEEFSFADIVKYIEIFQKAYPNNNFIEEKIRQQITVLRDRGIIESLDRWRYQFKNYSKK